MEQPEKAPSLGQQIRDWRKTRNIGRAEACKRLGVPKRTLEAWEQGRYEPSGAHRERITHLILCQRHQALPDLMDAIRAMQSAESHIRRALGAGDINHASRDRLDRIAINLKGYAAELERLWSGDLSMVPPAGSVL